MHRVCGLYAQWFNNRTGRTGHLFQERFKSEPVSDDAYLLTVVRYIHENPQKAGLGAMGTYRWSSFSEYAYRSRICTTDYVLDIFGGKEQFLRFHAQSHAERRCMDIDGPRNATRPMPDSRALSLARDVLGGMPLADIKAMPKGTRNTLLRRMKDAGLSIRQIERLTGISKNIVEYATRPLFSDK